MTTVNLTREEMKVRLIEAIYNGMDYESLYQFVEYRLDLEFEGYTDQELETEYKERFEES